MLYKILINLNRSEEKWELVEPVEFVSHWFNNSETWLRHAQQIDENPFELKSYKNFATALLKDGGMPFRSAQIKILDESNQVLIYFIDADIDIETPLWIAQLLKKYKIPTEYFSQDMEHWLQQTTTPELFEELSPELHG